MIKREVLHRAEVKTVYSSERQERMKVYFDLSQKYEECMEPCKMQPVEMQDECRTGCEKIYDEYAKILEPRYEGENKGRLEMEVKSLPCFRARRREDRKGWFYNITLMGWGEFLGYDTTPEIKSESWRV